MSEQDIIEQAEKVYSRSYTQNYEDKQSAWIAAIQWYREQNVEGELKAEISLLKDKIWDLEADIDDKDDEISDLEKQLEAVKTQ